MNGSELNHTTDTPISTSSKSLQPNIYHLYLLVDNQATTLTYIEIHPEVKIELPSTLQHFFLVISSHCITTSNEIRIKYSLYINSSDWNSI